MGEYDVAQICSNGHVINTTSRKFPEHNQDHCDRCGEQTLTRCPGCTTYIRGYYHVPGVFGGDEYRAPAYCYKCGRPFPWTVTALTAAQELVAESEQL